MTDNKDVMQQALDALVMVRDAGVTEHALTANQWNVVYNAISPLFELIERSAAIAQPEQTATNYTYASTQETNCAGCGLLKHTPLRVDEMDGYVCLTCIDKKLESLFGAAITQPEQPAPKIIAYITRHDDGDMLWFDKDEALDYCDEDSPPESLVLVSDINIAQPEQQTENDTDIFALRQVAIIAEQVLCDMQAKDLLIEWQTVLEEAIDATAQPKDKP